MQRPKLRENEDGVIAIVVTIVVLVVITITVLGFAQLARREERQALDRQLNAAAAYAAEAGVNDAAGVIKANLASGTAVAAKNNCTTSGTYSPNGQTMPLPTGYSSLLGNISVSTEYTCLLVNPTPSSLEYASIPVDTSLRADVTLSGGGGGNTKYIVIGWSGNNKTFTATGGTKNFPKSQNWITATNQRYAPVLRADVTDMGGNDYSRNGMSNNTYTGFFYPEAGGVNGYGTVTFGASNTGSNRGEIIGGSCNTGHPRTGALALFMPQDCNVVIDVSSLASSHFLLRFKGIYDPARVTVYALSATNARQDFSGGQVVVDATGKATDVLSRRQVRLSYQPPVVSDYAAQGADSICKRLFTSSVTGTQLDGLITGTEAANTAACNPT